MGSAEDGARSRRRCEERLQWQPPTRPWPRPATSGSWPTSTRARPRRPSGSCTTPGSTTRSARSTRAPRRWTGCRRSRNAASRSRPPRPRSRGVITPSTSSTPPGTSTSPSRWSGRCGCSTARWRSTTRSPGSSRRPRQVWRQADKYGVPRICFVNKMDRTGANFFRTVDMILERLNATPLVLQLPWGVEADFVGVIDLVEMKGLRWTSEDKGATYETVDIPADLADEAATWRATLLETLAEGDDQILEAYLGGEELSVGRAEGRHPARHHRAALHAGAVRLRVQEQGRAAHARRGGRLPALAAGRPVHRRAPRSTARPRSSGTPIRTSRSRRWPSRSRPTSTSAS